MVAFPHSCHHTTIGIQVLDPDSDLTLEAFCKVYLREYSEMFHKLQQAVISDPGRLVVRTFSVSVGVVCF